MSDKNAVLVVEATENSLDNVTEFIDDFLRISRRKKYLVPKKIYDGLRSNSLWKLKRNATEMS